MKYDEVDYVIKLSRNRTVRKLRENLQKFSALARDIAYGIDELNGHNDAVAEQFRQIAARGADYLSTLGKSDE